MSDLGSKALKGAVAGVVGTLAMDLVWYRRYRRDGGIDGFADWDLATGVGSFAEASAPAQVGQKIAGTLGAELPDRSAATVTNVMHWLTGVGYATVGRTLLPERTNPVVAGLAVGAGAYLNSYVTLGVMGIYEPMWDYDAETLTKDLTAHLTYGLVSAAVYRLVAGRASA